VSVDDTDWNAATNADPTVCTNATDIVFPTAGGDWSSGATFSHAGLWLHASSTTEANFGGFGALAVGRTVLNGDTLTIPAGSLSISIDVTP
jgi:hypothetical protein